MGNKILLAGDIMLDKYVFGSVKRISPEAPVPVLLEQKNKEKYVPGGAANVAVNIKIAGADVDLLAVVGNDSEGKCLCNTLEEYNIGIDYVVALDDRPTTCKLRYIGQNNQQVFRVDSENVKLVSEDEMDRCLKRIELRIADYCLIVLSDYEKGVLSESVCQKLVELGRNNNISVLVDVKGSNSGKYKGATLLKPNRSELADLTGMPVSNLEEVESAAVYLSRENDCRYVLATLGADGMMLVDKNSSIKHIKTVASEVYDVTGAGDTSLAYLATSLAKGFDLEESVAIANIAAGIQVSKMGTSLVLPEEVERAGNKLDDYSGKNLDFYSTHGLDKLTYSREEKKVVFTNGCFDILHAGHVTYLKKAKELGDVLVVGLNSDDSVRRLKGDNRPINSAEDRMKILTSLEFVDYVVIFDEDTPIELIKKVRPDILVKGGDYDVETIVGADFVRSTGGIVTTIPLVEGKSTTGLIERINSESSSIQS